MLMLLEFFNLWWVSEEFFYYTVFSIPILNFFLFERSTVSSLWISDYTAEFLNRFGIPTKNLKLKLVDSYFTNKVIGLFVKSGCFVICRIKTQCITCGWRLVSSSQTSTSTTKIPNLWVQFCSNMTLMYTLTANIVFFHTCLLCGCFCNS
jgi:hypothetical protein